MLMLPIKAHPGNITLAPYSSVILIKNKKITEGNHHFQMQMLSIANITISTFFITETGTYFNPR